MNLPILNLRVAPFVLCSECGTLSEYGKKKTCWACSAELIVNETTRLQFQLLNTGAQGRPYTPYVKCPNCRRLLQMGTDRCPECYEEVTEEYAFVSALHEVMKTIACDFARTISSFNTFAVIAVIVSAALVVYSVVTESFGFPLVVPAFALVPLVLVMIWFNKFGALDESDEEYLSAKREVKRSLKIWLLILAAQVFVIFLLIFPH